MDWSRCEFVECIPDVMGGIPVLRETRVPADTIARGEELGETAEELAYNYDLGIELVRAVLDYMHAERAPQAAAA